MAGLAAGAGELTGTFFPGAGFVDGQSAALDFLAVEGGDGCIGFRRVRHGDKRETAGTARRPVHHESDLSDFAMLGEKILKIVFRRLKREITYVQFHYDFLEQSCELQSRSREPGFKSPLRKSQLTIYHATNKTDLIQ